MAKESGLSRVEEYLVKHDNEQVCVGVLLEVSGVSHIPGLIRQLRDRGWVIHHQRFHCDRCDGVRSHFMLTGSVPSRKRSPIPLAARKHLITAFGGCDAFTGMPSPRLEADHRIPHRLSVSDEAKVTVDDVCDRYQALTPASNQQKNAACRQCQMEGQRPAFMGIPVWMEGSSARPTSCDLCPYAYPERWREHVVTYVNLGLGVMRTA